MFFGAGRQLGAKPKFGSFTVTKSSLPLELTFTLLKGCAYNVNENGRSMFVSQSSQWLPLSLTPGTTVFVPVAITYWGGHVGVGVNVGASTMF